MNAWQDFHDLRPMPHLGACTEEGRTDRGSASFPASGFIGQDRRTDRLSAHGNADDTLFRPASRLAGLPVPPRQWLVDGLIPWATVTAFYGDGGTGKSLVAFQLAVATALGRPWLGLALERSGKAMYLSAEDDDDELHRRKADICAAEGVGIDNLSGLLERSLAGEDALLAMLDRATNTLVSTPLFDRVEREILEHKPSLVVFDTLADLHSGDENSRAHGRQFVGMLRGLAIRHDCAVLFLAHPSLTGMASGTGSSGSTSWSNSVRSRLYLQRIRNEGYEADPDARVLTTVKSNYGRCGGEIALHWRDGVFIADAPETGIDRLAATAKAERTFLKLLDALTAQGRYVSSSPGPTYAPSQFASHPEAEGCTKRVLKSAMDALFGRGEIVTASHGSGAKARSHIARKGAAEGKK